MSLPLPVSLWTMMDNYFVSLVATWCAKYSDLAGARVVIGDSYNPSAVDFPFVLIRSTERKLIEGEPEFGDGFFHLDGIYYPYEFVVAGVFADLSAAKNFATNVAASLSYFIADNIDSLGLLIAADGEGVQLFELDDGEVQATGLAGQQPEGMYTGSGCVKIRVYTKR